MSRDWCLPDLLRRWPIAASSKTSLSPCPIRTLREVLGQLVFEAITDVIKTQFSSLGPRPLTAQRRIVVLAYEGDNATTPSAFSVRELGDSLGLLAKQMGMNQSVLITNHCPRVCEFFLKSHRHHPRSLSPPSSILIFDVVSHIGGTSVLSFPTLVQLAELSLRQVSEPTI